MIAINKAEKEAIQKRFPNLHIVRTVKQKSKRHRYYCEETWKVTQFLEKLRSNVDEVYTKEGGYHTNRKKAKRNSH